MYNEDIICIAPNPWTDLWRRRQQLMSRFAQRGCRVLYIEPQRSILTPFENKRRFGWDLDFRFGLRQETENLYVYAPVNPLPFSRYQFFDRINDAFVFSKIRRIVRRLEMKKPLLWTYYTPKTVGMVQAIYKMTIPRIICFDCYDHYASFDGVRPSEKSRIVAEERELVKRADMVFVVNEKLFMDKKDYNRNTYLIPNGIDMEMYEKSYSVPNDIADITHPIIGFTGKIDCMKIDLNLIRYLVEKRPEWSVVLVGPIFPDVQRIITGWTRYNNLHFLGMKEPKELPAYVRGFDVCIAPYPYSEHHHYHSTWTSAPLKSYEYLAAGKPIVVTGISIAPFLRNFVRKANNSSEFVMHIEACLKDNNEALARNRIEIARENSWDVRVGKITQIIVSQLDTR